MSFHKKFKFTVEIDGFSRAGFQSMSELSADVAVVERWEGGSVTAQKEPGRVTFADVTLARGASVDRDAHEWFKEVVAVTSGLGAPTDEYQRTVDLVQSDRDGAELRRWRLYDAWPRRFVAGDWDNTADEDVVEQLVLAFRYFDQV